MGTAEGRDRLEAGGDAALDRRARAVARLLEQGRDAPPGLVDGHATLRCCLPNDRRVGSGLGRAEPIPGRHQAVVQLGALAGKLVDTPRRDAGAEQRLDLLGGVGPLGGAQLLGQGVALGHELHQREAVESVLLDPGVHVRHARSIRPGP